MEDVVKREGIEVGSSGDPYTGRADILSGGRAALLPRFDIGGMGTAAGEPTIGPLVEARPEG